MKRRVLSATLVLFVIVTRAQPPKPISVEERLKKTTEIIQKDVTINATQKAAIEGAFKSFFIAADQLRKDHPPPPPPPPDPKVKEAMDKLVKERDERIKKVLSEEQYKQYKEVAKKLHPPKPHDPSKEPPPSNKR